MITKTGEQLIKEGVARWKDFIQNLSKADRGRLINSGVAKSEDAYINGINRGTVNILKRYGYTRGNINGLTPAQANKAKSVTQAQYTTAQAQNNQIGTARNLDALNFQKSDPNFGLNPLASPINPTSYDGAATVAYGKTIHTKGITPPKEVVTDNGQKLFNALVNRHEVYEAIAAERAYVNYLKNPQKGDRRAVATARKVNPLATASLTDQQILAALPLGNKAAAGIKTPGRLLSNIAKRPVNGHINIDVLGKERKLIDTFPYKDNDGYDYFRKMRNREYQYMDRAGDYQPIQEPGLISRVLTKLHLKKPASGSLERFNKNNFRKMTSKMKQGIPIDMGNGETWKPLY